MKLDGKIQSVTKRELIVYQVINKAASGDPKAGVTALGLFERYGPLEEQAEIPLEQTAYDLETLKHFFQMQGQLPVESNDADDDECA